MRLLARVYAGGPAPSKVFGFTFLGCLLESFSLADVLLILVVVEFYEAEIHGKVFVKDFIVFTDYPIHA